MPSVRGFKINSDLPGTRRSTRKQKLPITAPTERRLTLMTGSAVCKCYLTRADIG